MLSSSQSLVLSLRKSSSVFLSTLVVLLAVLIPPPSRAIEVFVDPRNGDDSWDGSEARPLRSLDRARDLVRGMNHNLGEDMVVTLREGTFQLRQTWQLDDRDSGSNGFFVVYRAFPGERVALVGAHWIFDWETHGAGQWKTSVGDLVSRQFFLNWHRRVRARSPRGWFNGTETATGYAGVSTDSGVSLQSFANIADVEFVDEIEWKQFRCSVASAGASTVTMQEPCWTRSQFHEPWTMGVPDWVENAYELLDQPGEWYLNRGTGWLYYKPHAGENINDAIGVMPVLEELLHVEGRSLDRPVHHIRFENLVFADTTWLQPDSDEGLPMVQANFYHADDQSIWELARPGASIEFVRSEDIVFRGNDFTRLGSAGLSFRGGCRRAVVENNHFWDMSGAALMIGEHINQIQADNRLWTEEVLVRNNYIHDVGVDYPSAPGIFLGNVQHSVVEYNELCNLPYTGISVGWNWGTGATDSGSNTIWLNHVHDHVTVLKDGGGLYSLGNQSGSRYFYNLMEGQVNSYGTMYLDQGSKGVAVINNVIVGNRQTALLKGENNAIKWNRWNDRGSIGGQMFDVCFYNPQPPICTDPPSSFSVEGNLAIDQKEQAEAWIWRSAGRLPDSPVSLEKYGDFDGDGLWDRLRIYQDDARWRVDASIRGAEFVWLQGWGTGVRNLIGDFTGDGRDDVVLLVGSSGNWSWYLASSRGDDFTQQTNVLTQYGHGYGLCSLDYDGDGAEEIIIDYDPSYCLNFDNSTQLFDVSECSRTCGANSYGDFRVCGSSVGACRPGVQVYDGHSWSACQGSVGPSAEINDFLDHDCDGLAGCNDPDNHCSLPDAGVDADGDAGTDTSADGDTQTPDAGADTDTGTDTSTNGDASTNTDVEDVDSEADINRQGSGCHCHHGSAPLGPLSFVVFGWFCFVRIRRLWDSPD